MALFLSSVSKYGNSHNVSYGTKDFISFSNLRNIPY
jgi:hypothetical protein